MPATVDAMVQQHMVRLTQYKSGQWKVEYVHTTGGARHIATEILDTGDRTREIGKWTAMGMIQSICTDELVSHAAEPR